jgi:hypothetical protein
MKYRAFRQNDANALCAIALRAHDARKSISAGLAIWHVSQVSLASRVESWQR